MASYLAAYAPALPYKREVEAASQQQFPDHERSDLSLAVMSSLGSIPPHSQIALTHASKQHFLNPHFTEDYMHEAGRLQLATPARCERAAQALAGICGRFCQGSVS